MKKILGLVAIATLALVSCNKEEGPAVNDGPKAVTIDIQNVIAATKSADGAVADDSPVQVNDLQVFFSDGTNLYRGKTIDGKEGEANIKHWFNSYASYTDNDADESAADAVANDRIYHFLDAAVSKVIVIANYGKEIATTDASTEQALFAILDPLYKVADQQDDSKLYLYATANLTTTTGEDKLGHPLYKATVKLEPRVSRLEVTGFEYAKITQAKIDKMKAAGEDVEGLVADAPRKYKSIKVEQVVFNGWYETAKTQTADATTWTKETAKITNAKVFEYFSEQETAAKWNNDMLTGAANHVAAVDLKAENYNWAVASNTDLRPAYNFFPKGSQIAGTQLVVKLTATLENATEADTDDTKVALYLATKSFSPAIEQALAKVYQVNFVFDDTDLENPEKCVEVTVDVVKWDVQAVTPEF